MRGEKYTEVTKVGINTGEISSKSFESDLSKTLTGSEHDIYITIKRTQR